MDLLTKKIRQYPKKLKREIERLPILQAMGEARYYQLLQKHAPLIPQLNPEDYPILHQLKEESTYITSIDKFDINGTDLMFTVAANLAAKLKFQFPEDGLNNQAIDLTKSHLIQYPEIFLWGLEERLLNIVENYISLPVIYQGLSLRRDIANGEFVGVRKWHLDWEDRRVIKIIVYLNDVDFNGGPYEYIPKKFTAMAMTNLQYQDLGFFSDVQMKTAIAKSDWQTCIGKAGTIIISDTRSIFHRAKPPITNDRFSLTFCYTSYQPQIIWQDKPFTQDQRKLILSQINQRQKNCLRELRSIIDNQ
jgi:hypothetical protein